jgi:2-iminoacetate synthase ThiH
MGLDRIAIEVTNRCAKACPFCSNHSRPGGDTRWSGDELVGFVRDCASHGVKAVSIGGASRSRATGSSRSWIACAGSCSDR